MKLNADLSVRVVIDSGYNSNSNGGNHNIEWVASPAKGVWRKMLDRDGDEIARATTIVKFDPAMNFPEHTHHGGEEFIVLDGVFSDAAGDYPKGYYCRHPIDSHHQPWSDPNVGCILLVKLYQMVDNQEPTILLDTRDIQSYKDEIAIEGKRRVMKLFENSQTGEKVTMERWEANTSSKMEYPCGGEEIFVVEGIID